PRLPCNAPCAERLAPRCLKCRLRPSSRTPRSLLPRPSMTVAELDALTTGGESPQIEFKLTTGQRSEGARTACAMLNGSGGFILFGVDDDGRIRGMTVTTKTIDDLVHELRRIDPLPAITPERVPAGDGREALVLSIPGTPAARTPM